MTQLQISYSTPQILDKKLLGGQIEELKGKNNLLKE